MLESNLRIKTSPVTESSQPASAARTNYLNSERGLKSWLLTQDHKRIALLYLFTTLFFFTIGGCAAAIIRLELLTPAGDLVASDTYNKLFSIHGIIMVFFFLVPIAPAVFGNFLIPLMIGAKDVALPKVNLASYYLFLIGGCVELYMMIVGGVDTGWTHHSAQHALPQHECCGSSHGNLYRRVLFDSHRAELRGHNSQDARPGYDVVPPSAIYMVVLRYVYHFHSGDADDCDFDGAHCC